MKTPDFIGFPKISRLFRDVIISEKIDGTNSQVYIARSEDQISFPSNAIGGAFMINDELHFMMAGSRSRWITPESDNHGFARWVLANQQELQKLGPGQHFGEWWGQGIQRKYGMAEKRWSLFNVSRWCLHDHPPGIIPTADPRIEKWQEKLPECVGLVPVIYSGFFSTNAVLETLKELEKNGSQAAPGFMNPEGIVVFHTASNRCFKVTLENDGIPKSLV